MSKMIEIFSPMDDEDGTKNTFRAWLKNIGDAVLQDEAIAEIETDKVTIEIHAPCDGVLTEVFFTADEMVEKGSLLAKITKASADKSSIAVIEKAEIIVEDVKAQSQVTNAPLVDNQQRLYSPAVRKLLAENQLNSSGIIGTGRDRRITKHDVLAHLKASKPSQMSVNSDMPSIMQPHSNMRRAIAEHMQHSVSTAPHVTAVFEADLSAIVAHRKAHKHEYAAQNVNLSFTAYFIAATVKALQAVPKVNSRWHDEALEIFSCLNIGIGTALGDEGLIVPVIQNAQDLNLMGIAKQLQLLTQKARDKDLKPSDLKNGTFTISNHGTSGSLVATPIIINQPQSAILGIGKMQKRPVVVEHNGVDALVIKPMCYVSLTIDHRVLDGHQTNQFLSHFVETLETWS